MGLLFLFGTAEATGDPTNDDPVLAAQQEQALLQQKLKKQRNASRYWRKKADTWAHKRNNHLRHRVLPPKKSLAYEKYRTKVWRKIAEKQRKKSVAFVRRQRAQVTKCAGLGPSRALCTDIIRGAKMAGKPSWAFDPNLMWIMRHESGFRPCVRNGGILDCNYHGDRAYGLFQFLGSTWAGVGCRITSAADVQTMCGIRYISRRYGSSANAVSFWRANRWY